MRGCTPWLARFLENTHYPSRDFAIGLAGMPARHVVGLEATKSVKDKLGTANEEPGDFADTSCSADV